MPSDYLSRRDPELDAAWASILRDLADPTRQIDAWRVMAAWLGEIRQQTALLAVIAQELGARVSPQDQRMRHREEHERLHPPAPAPP